MVKSILDHHTAAVGGVKLGLMADSIEVRRGADADISKARRSATKRLRTSVARLRIALRRRPLLSVMLLALLCIVAICVAALKFLYRGDNARPTGRTGMLKAKTPSGDARFEWNGQPYAVTPAGGIYVDDADLVQPTHLWGGHVYNRANARHLAGDVPSTITLLPGFLSDEEVASLLEDRDRAIDDDLSDGSTTTIPHGPLERLLINRLKPYARLGVERAGYWKVTDDSFTMDVWLDGLRKRFGPRSDRLPRTLGELRQFFAFTNLEPPYTATGGETARMAMELELEKYVPSWPAPAHAVRARRREWWGACRRGGGNGACAAPRPWSPVHLVRGGITGPDALHHRPPRPRPPRRRSSGTGR